jgi:hypothetical protein
MLIRSWWTNSFSGIQWRGKKGRNAHLGRTGGQWHCGDTCDTRKRLARTWAIRCRLSNSSVAAFRSARLSARFSLPLSSGKISKCILILHASLIIVSLSALNRFHTGSCDILTLGRQPALTEIVTWDQGRRILINCKVWWRQRLGI